MSKFPLESVPKRHPQIVSGAPGNMTFRASRPCEAALQRLGLELGSERRRLAGAEGGQVAGSSNAGFQSAPCQWLLSGILRDGSRGKAPGMELSEVLPGMSQGGFLASCSACRPRAVTCPEPCGASESWACQHVCWLL